MRFRDRPDVHGFLARMQDSEYRSRVRDYRETTPRAQIKAERTFVSMVRLSDEEVLDGSVAQDLTPTDLLRSLRDRITEWPSGREVGIWGYGSIFDVGYLFADEWGPYVEHMAREAFEPSVTQENIQTSVLRSHEGLGLATTRAGRMTFGTDDLGLGFAASLNIEESDARDVLQKLRTGSTPFDTSVGGTIIKSSWNKDYDHLTIHEWSLNRGEISIVRAGANPAGWVDVVQPAVKVTGQLLTTQLEKIQ